MNINGHDCRHWVFVIPNRVSFYMTKSSCDWRPFFSSSINAEAFTVFVCWQGAAFLPIMKSDQ